MLLQRTTVAVNIVKLKTLVRMYTCSITQVCNGIPSPLTMPAGGKFENESMTDWPTFSNGQIKFPNFPLILSILDKSKTISPAFPGLPGCLGSMKHSYIVTVHVCTFSGLILS